jgi:CP family cyanate transporter-like MFS transporter
VSTETEPTSSPAPPSADGLRRAEGTQVLVGVLLMALNLRLAITAVPPLVERIGTDLHLSSAATGVLTTLPVLSMGVFAPVAQRLAHRRGRESALVLAAAAVLVGSLLRLGGQSLVLLYAGTLVAGFGIAVGGTITPGVIKEHFSDRVGPVTALYMLAMMGGAAAASAASVPLADAWGWPVALGVWAAPAALALVAWLPLARTASRRAETPDDGPRVGLPWRHGTTWAVAAYLAVQSWQFYSQLAWIPPLYEARGWTAARAGVLLSVFSATQVISGVAGPALAHRMRDRRPILLTSVACVGLGLAGILFAPELAAWVWVGLLGLGLGSGFAMGLVLFADYSVSPAASARLSAAVFLVSYSVAAAGPVTIGALRDATGSFTVPFALLLVLVLPQAVAATLLRPGRAQTP